jgi:5-hydroxyisourate hydrolase-like protein (transthyretin family)
VPTFRDACRLAPALTLALACAGADLVLPDDGEPAAIEILQGTPQSGRVGADLNELVVARVTDSQNRPIADARVVLVFTQDGSGATAVPDTALTDADGQASFQVVMGSRVGPVEAEVRVSTAGGQRTLTAPLAFTAISADADELLLVSGDSQSAPVGAPLPDPLVVQVTDAFGNPIVGVAIGWTVEGGGGVSESSTLTGENGFASVDRVLGPDAGIQRSTATAPGLAGSPVTFVHTARAGSAAVLERVSGDGQSALAGTSLPAPLVVRARDGADNPVPGLAVTWVVGAGGGQLTPETSITDGEGLASSSWTLGPSPQPNTATAVVSGVGTVGFSATATAGIPPSLALETQPAGSAVRGIALSRAPVIQLREPDGSPRRRAGVAVSVSLAGAGGVLRGTSTRATGNDGRAEFGGLSLEGPPGSYALKFAAADYVGVTSSAIALERAPTSTRILSDDPDPSNIGTPVRVRFTVESPGGAPSGTVRVTSDEGASCTATVAGGECSLVLTTAGNRTLTAAFTGGAEFADSRDSESHVVATTPPPPPPTTPSASRSTVTVAKASLDPGERTDVTVTVRDESGRPLADVAVILTATGSGNTITPTQQSSDGNGIARFDFSASEGGTRTLTAEAGGVTIAQQPTVSVGEALPSLEVRDQPSRTAKSGEPLRKQPEIQLRGVDGEELEREGVTVTASLVSGPGSLGGTATAVTDNKGRARFADLELDGASGRYVLRFSAAGFTSVTSDAIELH